MNNRIYTNKQEAAMQACTASPEFYNDRVQGGLGTVGGDAVRATAIPDALCELDNELSQLNTLAQVLHDRLQPVMYPPSPSDPVKDSNGHSVPLVSRIFDFRQQVRMTANVLRDALQRLEL